MSYHKNQALYLRQKAQEEDSGSLTGWWSPNHVGGQDAGIVGLIEYVEKT